MKQMTYWTAALLSALMTLGGTSTLATAGIHHGAYLLRFEFGEYLPSEPAWRAGGISCASGVVIVGHRGFYDVESFECHGRIFTYLGRYHGDSFRIFVNSRTGRIIGVAEA